MFNNNLTEIELVEMDVLCILVDALCIQYMIDTGKPVTAFDMVKAILVSTFEDVFKTEKS